MRIRGMVLIEVVVALFVATVAVVVLMGNFSSNKKLAMATRQRTAALLLSSNLLERLRAHPYGVAAPSNWPSNTAPATGWERQSGPQVARLAAGTPGQPEAMVFYQQFAFKTGGAVGTSDSDTDAATITVMWQERNEQRSLTSTVLLRRKP